MNASALITGQTALVTGASRGIGKAIAIALGAAGAEVVINYANSTQQAEEVVSTITAAGGKAYSLKANIADESEVNDLIQTVLKRSNQIDILVNNAGITRDGLLMRMNTHQRVPNQRWFGGYFR